MSRGSPSRHQKGKPPNGEPTLPTLCGIRWGWATRARADLPRQACVSRGGRAGLAGSVRAGLALFVFSARVELALSCGDGGLRGFLSKGVRYRAWVASGGIRGWPGGIGRARADECGGIGSRDWVRVASVGRVRMGGWYRKSTCERAVASGGRHQLVCANERGGIDESVFDRASELWRAFRVKVGGGGAIGCLVGRGLLRSLWRSWACGLAPFRGGQGGAVVGRSVGASGLVACECWGSFGYEGVYRFSVVCCCA